MEVVIILQFLRSGDYFIGELGQGVFEEYRLKVEFFLVERVED